MSDPLMQEALSQAAHDKLMEAAKKGFQGDPLTAAQSAALEAQEMERREQHAKFLASLKD